MRIQERRQSEAAFKVAKNKHQYHESYSINPEIPDEELSISLISFQEELEGTKESFH